MIKIEEVSPGLLRPRSEYPAGALYSPAAARNMDEVAASEVLEAVAAVAVAPAEVGNNILFNKKAHLNKVGFFLMRSIYRDLKSFLRICYDRLDVINLLGKC